MCRRPVSSSWATAGRRTLWALTQKKEQYTDTGFNMGYYIYIYQEQI